MNNNPLPREQKKSTKIKEAKEPDLKVWRFFGFLTVVILVLALISALINYAVLGY